MKLISVEVIVEACGEFYNIPTRIIFSKSRLKSVARARAISMFLARELTNMSYPELAEEYNRDYSTIIKAVQKITDSFKRYSDEIHHLITRITANNKAAL